MGVLIMSVQMGPLMQCPLYFMVILSSHPVVTYHILTTYSSMFVVLLLFFYSYDTKIEHYRVIKKNNLVTVDDEEFFENLFKLVEVL